MPEGLNFNPSGTFISIFEATGMPMEDFAAQLAHSKNAFVDWRYIHEKHDENFISVKFLGDFASAVETVALRTKDAV